MVKTVMSGRKLIVKLHLCPNKPATCRDYGSSPTAVFSEHVKEPVPREPLRS